MSTPQEVPAYVNEIKEFVTKRLISVDPSVKSRFPQILREPRLQWITFSTDTLIGVVFLTDADSKRVDDFRAKGWDPFPGLFARSGTPAAFAFERSTYQFLSSNQVTNTVAFAIGQDSSLVVVNHTQTINSIEAGAVSYVVPLAYFVSFGTQITRSNFLHHLDELIAYSVDKWLGR